MGLWEKILSEFLPGFGQEKNEKCMIDAMALLCRSDGIQHLELRKKQSTEGWEHMRSKMPSIDIVLLSKYICQNSAPFFWISLDFSGFFCFSLFFSVCSCFLLDFSVLISALTLLRRISARSNINTETQNAEKHIKIQTNPEKNRDIQRKPEKSRENHHNPPKHQGVFAIG